MWRILGVVLAPIVAVGCRGDVQQCKQACRNFGNLVEWKALEAEIAAAPPDQRDALRKTRTGELDGRVEACVGKCVSGNDQAAVDCLIAAKTADQALVCAR